MGTTNIFFINEPKPKSVTIILALYPAFNQERNCRHAIFTLFWL